MTEEEKREFIKALRPVFKEFLDRIEGMITEYAKEYIKDMEWGRDLIDDSKRPE